MNVHQLMNEMNERLYLTSIENEAYRPLAMTNANIPRKKENYLQKKIEKSININYGIKITSS